MAGKKPAALIRDLILVVEEFRKLDPEIQAQTVMTFLMVAEKPGISMKTMQDSLGIARSTMSRNVAYLSSHKTAAGKKGHGLLESREDPEDRKQKLVYLTSKGRAVMASLLNIMER